VPDANEPVLVWEFVRWIGAMVRDGKDVANYELICVEDGLVEGGEGFELDPEYAFGVNHVRREVYFLTATQEVEDMQDIQPPEVVPPPAPARAAEPLIVEGAGVWGYNRGAVAAAPLAPGAVRYHVFDPALANPDAAIWGPFREAAAAGAAAAPAPGGIGQIFPDDLPRVEVRPLDPIDDDLADEWFGDDDDDGVGN
jgi:hypothetical protein